VNWINLLVQIVGKIESTTSDNGILETKYVAVPVKRLKSSIKNDSTFLLISIWENSNQLSKNSPGSNKETYEISDYVLIEGFITINQIIKYSSQFSKNELFKITVINHSLYCKK